MLSVDEPILNLEQRWEERGRVGDGEKWILCGGGGYDRDECCRIETHRCTASLAACGARNKCEMVYLRETGEGNEL